MACFVSFQYVWLRNIGYCMNMGDFTIHHHFQFGQYSLGWHHTPLKLRPYEISWKSVKSPFKMFHARLSRCCLVYFVLSLDFICYSSKYQNSFTHELFGQFNNTGCFHWLSGSFSLLFCLHCTLLHWSYLYLNVFSVILSFFSLLYLDHL